MTTTIFFAFDHRSRKIEVPVRSPVLKPTADWLVVGWVTTSESPLLYVLFCIWNVWNFWTWWTWWPRELVPFGPFTFPLYSA